MSSSDLIFGKKARWKRAESLPRNTTIRRICIMERQTGTYDVWYDADARAIWLSDTDTYAEPLHVYRLLLSDASAHGPGKSTRELFEPALAGVRQAGYELESYVGVLFDPAFNLYKPEFDYGQPLQLSSVELTREGSLSMWYWTWMESKRLCRRWALTPPEAVRFVRTPDRVFANRVLPQQGGRQIELRS